MRVQARDVYEEAVQTVMTVRDFSQVFDSYAQFEESMIAAKMETASELGKEDDGAWERGPGAGWGWGGLRTPGFSVLCLSFPGAGGLCCSSCSSLLWGRGAPSKLGICSPWGMGLVEGGAGLTPSTPFPPPPPDEVELELRLARFERLMLRRPLLLNSVLLRQNPHNVHEWHKRVQLHAGNPQQVRVLVGPLGVRQRMPLQVYGGGQQDRQGSWNASAGGRGHCEVGAHRMP